MYNFRFRGLAASFSDAVPRSWCTMHEHTWRSTWTEGADVVSHTLPN